LLSLYLSVTIKATVGQMKNLKIFAKLFLSHTAIGLVSIAGLSTTVYFIVSSILIQRTLDQLTSINILKKDLVENYFLSARQNLQELQVENKFLKLYNTLSTDPEMHQAQSAVDLLEMDTIGKLYDFTNLYLFDKQHKLIFNTGPNKFQHGLEKVIDSMASKNFRQLQIIDVTRFATDKQTLLYYYIPVISDGELAGMVLVQENINKIQKILLENTGLGNTGESYLIGNDLSMRSTSRFFPERKPASIMVNTEAAKNSLKGNAGQGIFEDYRQVKVLSVYRPLENNDLHWTIISEIDWDQAMEPIIELRNYLIVITMLILAMTLTIVYLLSNVIAKPVLQLKEIIVALSKGMRPDVRPAIGSTDEIGLMAKSVEELMEGMERTTTFANEIGAGNFKTTFTKLSEHDSLGNALIRMRSELQSFHEREIRSARERTAALLEGQEKERKRIISELHDGVGQLLTAIRMRVDMLENVDALRDEIKSHINETIAEVKRISYNVMPQSLVDFGLEAALKGLCDNVRKYSGLHIDFRYVKEVTHTLNFDITVCVFRIAQEGLNNIVKHAKATKVTLHVLDKEDELYFMLEDNGKGFNETKMVNNSGLGLRNIRERATLLNGQVEINSTPDVGTVIEIHIPAQDNV
jgi:two-component system NarL family sensor kinase